jgi:hypothetical protein
VVALEQLKVEYRDRRARRLKRTLDAAVSLDATAEDILRRFRENERFAQLLEDAIDAAMGRVDESIQAALGRAAGSGALTEDDAAVSAAEMRVRSRRDMDASHVRVLRFLDEPRPDRQAM